MVYFDKVDAFLDETRLGGGNKRKFNDVINSVSADIDTGTKKLVAYIKQSKNDFIDKNYGWMAYSNDFAFDAAELLPEWLELQKKYDEYKERMWNILSGINALQVCTNNVNVTGNNITVNQAMSCVQTIQNSDTTENEEKQVEDDGHGNFETKRNEEINKEEEKVIEETKNEDTTNMEENINENVEENSGNNIVVYVIFGVIIIVIFGVSLFLLLKPPAKITSNKLNSDVTLSINN